MPYILVVEKEVSKVTRRNVPDTKLVEDAAQLLNELRLRGVKRRDEYAALKAILKPRGYKPFDIMVAYQYLVGSTRGNWDASVRLAAAIANRR